MLGKKKMFRQGDVLLVKIDERDLPMDLKEKDMVLAYGEVTGHKHQFLEEPEQIVEVLENEGKQYVKVKSDKAVLRHEEHAPVSVPKGDYKVILQREYDPIQSYKEEQAKIRQVRD
jgi:hypothetical protein